MRFMSKSDVAHLIRIHQLSKYGGAVKFTPGEFVEKFGIPEHGLGALPVPVVFLDGKFVVGHASNENWLK